MASAFSPKLGDRSLFSALRCRAYLNHAAISAPSDPVREAVAKLTAQLAQDGALAFSGVLEQRDALRDKLARLLGCASSDIALVPSTMYGLSQVALSLPYRKGERIVALHGEYPSNVHCWQRAAELFSVELCLLPVSDFELAAGPDLSRLEAELSRGNVRVVAVSAVQFQSGLRMPLAELSRLCHAHGAELVVDAVQALGALPLDVRALDIDYLVAGSHKWLMGLDGCGVLYAKPEKISALRPALVGAMSYDGALDLLMGGPGHLRYDRRLRGDVRVFEGGMMSSTSCAALDASVELILELGPAAIYAHVQRYHDLLEPALVARGFRSLRAPDDARRSCTLSFVPPTQVSAVALATQLGSLGVVLSAPDGVLRVAPHWPNALTEVPSVLASIDQALLALG